jgi:hypothetical protein
VRRKTPAVPWSAIRIVVPYRVERIVRALNHLQGDDDPERPWVHINALQAFLSDMQLRARSSPGTDPVAQPYASCGDTAWDRVMYTASVASSAVKHGVVESMRNEAGEILLRTTPAETHRNHRLLDDTIYEQYMARHNNAQEEE